MGSSRHSDNERGKIIELREKKFTGNSLMIDRSMKPLKQKTDRQPKLLEMLGGCTRPSHLV